MERQSNIELLRIISMAMVLTVHFVGATFGLPLPEELSNNPTSSMLIKTGLESISIIGVNCFILISGYFGIKASWRGISYFTGWCIFASLVVYAIKLFYVFVLGVGENLTIGDFLESLLVYSATDLWFVPAYLALYILSPVINGGLKSLSNKNLAWFIAGLVFLNVYLGWSRGGKINQFGYNEMQMIFMYVMGYFIKRNFAEFRKIAAFKYVAIYLFSTAGIFCMAFFMPSRTVYAYNSPFVVIASVSFFLIFAVMKSFHSKPVNWVASSAFMVYLIHKSPFVWIKLKTYLIELSCSASILDFAFSAILLFVAIFISCILIDKIRIASFRILFKRL